MRLCLSDADLGAPYRNIKIEYLKFIYNIGFRVAGMHPDFDATADDIKYVKDLFAEAGIEMGPYGISAAAIRPDKNEEKEHQRQIVKALEIAGKFGCTTLRYSVGSMHPTDIWLHHPENHTQKVLDMLIESTKKLVPIAEGNGVILCPETTQWTIVNGIERMKEYVDRLDSPYAKIIFDFVNHMTSDRVYDNGRFMKCAIAELGDRIGEFHVKDVKVEYKYLVCHIDEADVGTGLLDHEAVIRASTQLEPWKLFSLEHFRSKDLWKPGYDHIQGIANRIGHRWTDPKCTRKAWESGKYR